MINLEPLPYSKNIKKLAPLKLKISVNTYKDSNYNSKNKVINLDSIQSRNFKVKTQ